MNHTSQSTKRVPLYGYHPVTRKRGYIRAYALVDAEDYELVMGYRWHLDNNGYARANTPRDENGKRGFVLMHRLIMKNPKSDVDHKNWNRLDNRRSNLRLATRSQNIANSKLSSNNTSGYRGVVGDRATSKWCAQIKSNGKKRVLGCFSSKEDAARAYDAAALEVFGEFASTNF